MKSNKNSENSLVTIITPIYNCSEYIGDTINSVIHQTWKNWELILIDDGSTDNSFEVASSFASSRIKVLRQENAGASCARNHGLRLALGDYIQFLDADDLLSPQKIEHQINQLKQNEPETMASCAWGRFKGAPSQAIFIQDELWADFYPVEFLVKKYNNHSMMQPAVWLTPRSVIEKAGMWDESLSLNDDGEYFSRVVLASRTISFCEEAKVFYRSGNNLSLSGRKDLKAIQSHVKSIEQCSSQLLAHETSHRTRKAAANLYQQLVYELYPEFPETVMQLEEKIKQLGGSSRRFSNSPIAECIGYLLGWKRAKWLQHHYRKTAFSPT